MAIPMIVHKLKHKDGIYVYGLSDLHIGSQEFNEKRFIQYRDKMLESDNNYCVLVGDIIDNGTKNSVTGPYGQTMSPRDQREKAVELLIPIRDRVLGIVAGNHERRATKESDTDPMEIIADRLGLHYLYRPGTAFIEVNLGKRTSGHYDAPQYCVAISHGSSGGQLMGAGLNKADQFAIASGADLVIMGHSHKSALAAGSRLTYYPQRSAMKQSNYAVMICTAWLDYGGYPLDMAMKSLSISPNRAWLGSVRKEMRVIQDV